MGEDIHSARDAAVRIAVAVASLAACISADSCVDSDGLGATGARASSAPPTRWPYYGPQQTGIAPFTRQISSPTMPVDHLSSPHPHRQPAHPSTAYPCPTAPLPLSPAPLSVGSPFRGRPPGEEEAR